MTFTTALPRVGTRSTALLSIRQRALRRTLCAGPPSQPSSSGQKEGEEGAEKDGVDGEKAGEDDDVQGIQVVRVEQGGGMGGKDTGKDPDRTLARGVALAGGDLITLAAFATIGRVSHYEPVTLAGIASTAWPFALSWLASSLTLGGYGPEATGGRLVPSMKAFMKSYIAFVPTSIAIRSIARGYIPSSEFMVITAAMTAGMMGGWRALFSALATEETRQDEDRPGGPLSGPFEFLKMIQGVTKRW